MTNNQKSILKVEAALQAGKILRAYNALDREETTAGSYTEAVDRGFRFAVIGWAGKCPQTATTTAYEAAAIFVGRVGCSRAREAALA